MISSYHTNRQIVFYPDNQPSLSNYLPLHYDIMVESSEISTELFDMDSIATDYYSTTTTTI